jgi:hypothetical protein
VTDSVPKTIELQVYLEGLARRKRSRERALGGGGLEVLAYIAHDLVPVLIALLLVSMKKPFRLVPGGMGALGVKVQFPKPVPAFVGLQEGLLVTLE